jgi:hypothetical protein
MFNRDPQCLAKSGEIFTLNLMLHPRSPVKKGLHCRGALSRLSQCLDNQVPKSRHTLFSFNLEQLLHIKKSWTQRTVTRYLLKPPQTGEGEASKCVVTNLKNPGLMCINHETLLCVGQTPLFLGGVKIDRCWDHHSSLTLENGSLDFSTCNDKGVLM